MTLTYLISFYRSCCASNALSWSATSTLSAILLVQLLLTGSNKGYDLQFNLYIRFICLGACYCCAGTSASCTKSCLCVPSQYGGLRVCLHPHNQTVLASSSVNLSGDKPGALFLCEPSQNGSENKTEEDTCLFTPLIKYQIHFSLDENQDRSCISVI